MKLEVDKSVWDKMKRNLLRGSNLELQVGFFEGDRYSDGTQVAQVAKLNEEGHVNGSNSAFPGAVTPPRPFMRREFMQPIQRGAYDVYFIESVRKIAEGTSTFEKEYREIGKMAREDLQDVVQEFDNPNNADMTIQLKGFDNALIETGKMHDSVGFRISKGGDK